MLQSRGARLKVRKCGSTNVYVNVVFLLCMMQLSMKCLARQLIVTEPHTRALTGGCPRQNVPARCDSIFEDKILLFEPECPLVRRLEHNSVGPLRLRNRPTFRDIACARLASATAPASRSRKQSGLVTRTSTSVSRWLHTASKCGRNEQTNKKHDTEDRTN